LENYFFPFKSIFPGQVSSWIFCSKIDKRSRHIYKRYNESDGKTIWNFASRTFTPIASLIYIKNPLPHFIWVCELSSPDLYSKQLQCQGEIIWDATRNFNDGHMGLVIHLPNMLVFDNGAANNMSEDYQQITGVQNTPYSIYHNNLEEIK
jgi:hypothetical protein